MHYLFRSCIIFIGFLILWEGLILVFQLPSYILPSPPEVLNSFFSQYEILYHEAIPTILETLIGFILGVLFGIVAALIISYFSALSLWLLPLLIVSQAIPVFAIAPLLVIWFGYGLISKIATTVLMIFFPVCSAFYDGLKRTHEGWEALAKSMGAQRFRVFYFIRVPAALPALSSGIRIAAVIAPIGAIVGEWVGSSQGLGFLMLNANAQLQIDLVFSALIVIIFLALLLYFTVDCVLRNLIWWQLS